MNARSRVRSIVAALRRAYPDARTSLHYDDPWQLLITTIMSAQSTDETVNKVSPVLFSTFPTPQSLAAANPAQVEQLIYSTGFYRQKTRSIIATSKDLVEKFGGEVPQTIEELTSLRGVARKTANVVLANVWPGQGHGIFVDTHIRRVSQRLAWTPNDDPVKIERDLMELLPKKAWVDVPHQLIMLGRGPCNAQRPDHTACPLLKWCPTGQEALAAAPPAKSSRAKPSRRARAR